MPRFFLLVTQVMLLLGSGFLFFMIGVGSNSSGFSGRVGEGPENMNSMWLPLVSIFFMTGAGGRHGLLAPWIRYWVEWNK